MEAAKKERREAARAAVGVSLLECGVYGVCGVLLWMYYVVLFCLVLFMILVSFTLFFVISFAFVSALALVLVYALAEVSRV